MIPLALHQKSHHLSTWRLVISLSLLAFQTTSERITLDDSLQVDLSNLHDINRFLTKTELSPVETVTRVESKVFVSEIVIPIYNTVYETNNEKSKNDQPSVIGEKAKNQDEGRSGGEYLEWVDEDGSIIHEPVESSDSNKPAQPKRELVDGFNEYNENGDQKQKSAKDYDLERFIKEKINWVQLQKALGTITRTQTMTETATSTLTSLHTETKTRTKEVSNPSDHYNFGEKRVITTTTITTRDKGEQYVVTSILPSMNQEVRFNRENLIPPLIQNVYDIRSQLNYGHQSQESKHPFAEHFVNAHNPDTNYSSINKQDHWPNNCSNCRNKDSNRVNSIDRVRDEIRLRHYFEKEQGDPRSNYFTTKGRSEKNHDIDKKCSDNNQKDARCFDGGHKDANTGYSESDKSNHHFDFLKDYQDATLHDYDENLKNNTSTKRRGKKVDIDNFDKEVNNIYLEKGILDERSNRHNRFEMGRGNNNFDDEIDLNDPKLNRKTDSDTKTLFQKIGVLLKRIMPGNDKESADHKSLVSILRGINGIRQDIGSSLLSSSTTKSHPASPSMAIQSKSMTIQSKSMITTSDHYSQLPSDPTTISTTPTPSQKYSITITHTIKNYVQVSKTIYHPVSVRIPIVVSTTIVQPQIFPISISITKTLTSTNTARQPAITVRIPVPRSVTISTTKTHVSYKKVTILTTRTIPHRVPVTQYVRMTSVTTTLIPTTRYQEVTYKVPVPIPIPVTTHVTVTQPVPFPVSQTLKVYEVTTSTLNRFIQISVPMPVTVTKVVTQTENSVQVVTKTLPPSTVKVPYKVELSRGTTTLIATATVTTTATATVRDIETEAIVVTMTQVQTLNVEHPANYQPPRYPVA